MFEIMEMYKLYVVYYVVVYKYVLLMEDNFEEVVCNNILGMKNIVEVVKNVEVKKFVMIFMDKVVNLFNVMGVLKWIVEMII